MRTVEKRLLEKEMLQINNSLIKIVDMLGDIPEPSIHIVKVKQDIDKLYSTFLMVNKNINITRL